MASRLSPFAGTLLPHRYLHDRLRHDVRQWLAAGDDRLERHATRWWQSVERQCGPASGVRALFDLVAMPLFGMLGFRARNATFSPGRVHVRLETRRGTAVGLVVLPWATRPSTVWRELATVSRRIGAAWCFLLAPPFVSLVDVRGHATRRSLEFHFPAALDIESLPIFRALTSAAMFDAGAAPSPLDQLVAMGERYQDRVREDLRQGVTDALRQLTSVVNAASADRRFDESLTLIYRILFLLFVESRELVPSRDPIYEHAYAVGTLCRESLNASQPPGLWESLAAITRLSRQGCDTRDLHVSPFNGPLFARASAPSLENRRAAGRPTKRRVERDAALRRTLIALGTRPGSAGRESIHFRDLGVEQLGAVYEHVLDLDPTLLGSPPAASKRPARALTANERRTHSERRKQTGTFYTPRALAEFVVRRTLAPLVAGRSADDILRLRVLDPAMGSGAFLVAACHYLASAHEDALIEEGRHIATDFDDDARADIRRLVAERCLAGVDLNPVAVQLARLSLWLTTLARGKPLGFLDDRLRVGNSLVGASPGDLWRTAGRRGAETRARPLFDAAGLEHAIHGVSRTLEYLRMTRDDSVAAVREKEAQWARFESPRSPLHRWRTAASFWCARWFWPSTSTAPNAAETRALIDASLGNDRTLTPAHIERRVEELQKVVEAHRFFHWSLEFSDVFHESDGRPKAIAGFDAVLGNPPWEMLRRETQSRTADARCPSPSLVRFIRESEFYPSCNRGHVNLYQPFVERALALCRPGGRVGLIVPWGLAVDEGAAPLRRTLVDRSTLSTVVGLDNARGLFPIHRGVRFLAFVVAPGGTTTDIRARFGVKTSEELDALPAEESPLEPSAYPVRLTAAHLRLAGGASLRVPDVRRPRDLALLERLTRAFPPLSDHASWGAEFSRELNATDDRALFGARGLPVIEGKHVEPFATRVDTTLRIERDVARRRLPDHRFEQARLGYRDVAGVGNRLSLIAAIVPAHVVTTHTIFCLRTILPIDAQFFLCGVLNSYVLNALARMLMGGHLTTALVEALPVPRPDGSREQRTITRLSRNLSTHTASEMAAAELQSAVAVLYGIDTENFREILEGFPLVPAEARERAARALEKRMSGSGRNGTLPRNPVGRTRR